MRGIGAVAVVAEHMLPWVIPSLRPYWFNLGMYGVLVFFLVSGYIIPTSLERRGDVGGFWIGRVFRLYPLYLTVIALVMATSWWMPIRREVPRDSSSIAAHATMLQDVLGTGAAVDTMWTLAYEMVFYLLVTTLFVIGVHRRSGPIAIGFGAAAVVSGLLMAAAPIAPGPVAVLAGLRDLLRGPRLPDLRQVPYGRRLRHGRRRARPAGAEQQGAVVRAGDPRGDVRGNGDPAVGAPRGPAVAGGRHRRVGRAGPRVGDPRGLVVGASGRVDHHSRPGRRDVRPGDGAAKP
ncbi:acyltransferase [Nonomuraea dietziae]|uniref:acyltransferase family protein n=1 Tax=Nonomuraea dietziae TaxID=65515 RepID=UPI0031DA6067